jgi:4-amino-4-deoxy-L-arabinose transferase-like glycosyltransferase
MLAEFYPWLFLLPFGLWAASREIARGDFRSRILIVSIVSTLAVFTFVQTKLPWYVLPVYPAASILLSMLLRNALSSVPSRLALAALSCEIIGAGIVAWVDKSRLFQWVSGAGLIAVALLTVATLIMPTMRRFVAPMACLVLFILGSGDVATLYAVGESPVAQLAKAARRTDLEDRQPLILGISAPTPLFYSERPVHEAQTLEGVANLLRAVQPGHILLAAEHVGTVSEAFDLEVVARADNLVHAHIRPRLNDFRIVVPFARWLR